MSERASEARGMLNVLVVDDSVVMRRMVTRSLSMGGLPVGEVYEAGDGLEALGVVDSRWVDLVLCDINMPGMDGIEFMRRMAANEVTRRVPVVMVSTERSEPRIQELKELGIGGYLHKPFRPEDLAGLVRGVLGLESES